MQGPDDTLNSLQLGITKRYGNKVVLDNLQLDISKGEFVTFLGPSGCGKSTALSIVAGLIAATEGEIRLNGERIDHLPPEKRAFGMVFQNYALFPHMTVFDNVAFGLTLKPLAKDEVRKRTDAMLRLVQLTGYEERYPSQLSGGQQQRVAIARALVLHPRLMLFDEPLSNLDAKLRVEMRAEIKQIHAALGLTSIYVTHDQAEALSLSDRIVVLRNGILMQSGSPQEIHDRPKNVFVADFMGFRNFFKVKNRNGVAGYRRRRRRRPAHPRARGRKYSRWIRHGDGDSPRRYKLRPADCGRCAGCERPCRGGRVSRPRAGGGGAHQRRHPRVVAHRANRCERGDSIDLQFPLDKVVLLPAE